MNPLEYLKYSNDDIYEGLVGGNFNSPEKAKEIIQTLESFVKRLSEVRNSNEKTNLILNEIDKFPDNEMRSIKHWLAKSLEHDDSFAYAFNPLAQYSNGLNKFLTCYQIKTISRPEIYEILKAEESVSKVSTPTTKEVDYSKLLVALNNYITGITPNEFTNIIERHNFSPGTAKVLWVGKKKVDAWRFCKQLNMTNEEWNNLFRFPDGKKLHGKYKDKLDKDSPINEILKTHLIK